MNFATKTAAALGLSAILLVGGVASSAQASTVPNRFERTCSNWTSNCTVYKQVNGRYVASVSSVYITNWTWAWI